MRNALILAAVVIGVAVPSIATGSEESSTAPPTAPPTCDSAKAIIKRLAPGRWRERHPLRGTRWCGNDRRAVEKARARFREYRVYRRTARYPGPGSGPRSPADGRWWSIPWPIVCGESRGNFYVNADGAYQIIPSTWQAHGGGRFAAVAGDATPLEQHIIARAAWRAGEAWYGHC